MREGLPCHVTLKVRGDVPSLRSVKLAREVDRVFGRSGPVLADRYHSRVLRTSREVRNALAYVLLNARRHAARAGRIKAVSAPHGWLLSVGWRRRGLLSPAEVPGGGRAACAASAP